MAALKSYGLLEGAKDNLRLTELAQHILLDKRPDSTERDTYKRQAALSPDVAARVYAQWPDDLPSEATLNHYLVLNLGFSEQTSAKSVEIIKQNHIFTANGQSFIPAVQSRNDEIMPNIEYMKEVKDVGVTSNSQKTPFRLTTKSWFEQTTDPNGLNISLQFEDQPTKETYEYLVAFFTFKSTQIKKTPSDG